MYIVIYCSVIVVFCALVVAFFVLKDKRDKKRYKKLNERNDNEEKSKGVILSVNEGSPLGEEIGLKEEKASESVEFESFSLEDVVETKEEQSKRRRFNPFEFDDEEEKDDEDIDDKFAEYERFLRENLELDVDNEESNDNKETFAVDENSEQSETDKFAEYEEFLRKNLDLGDMDEEDSLHALRNFDYDSIRGKNESEIRQIIKKLPPKAQEILLTDILARKNWEEEN